MSKPQPIRKVVIPAAGLGTRMLPQTWATPKELLPIVDRPILHLVCEEAARAGMSDIVLIVSPGKESVAEYFDRPIALEETLAVRGKIQFLKPLLELQAKVRVKVVSQEKPLGLGHAILCARPVVGEESFAVLLPDEIFDGEPTPFEQLAVQRNAAAEDTGSVALMEVPRERTSRYGIVYGKAKEGRFYIDGAVEKPDPESAPSNLAIVGRYLLPSDTFAILERVKPGAGGEIQLTDALAELARQGRLIGTRISNRRFDTGSPAGWLAANEYFSKKRYNW